MTAKTFSRRHGAIGAVICGVLCLLMLLGLMFMTQTSANAAETTASGSCGEGVSWTLDDAGVLTVSGSGAMANYSQGGAPWYSQRESIKSVVIESGVTSIGNCAFIDHAALTSVKVPKSVTSIGAYALCNCTSLTGISLQRGIETIGNYAFHNSGLTVMVLPEGTVSIGYAAFHNCTALTSVTIPESVTSIGGYAFWNCTALKKIKFNAVALNGFSAKNYVFGNAGHEAAGIKVTVGAEVTVLPSYLFCPDNTTDAYYPKVTSVEFEEGSKCTDISVCVFERCASLESIVIPDSVTSIGAYAFCNCTSLKSINIPESLTSIGGYAFWRCIALEEIKFNAVALNDFGSKNYVFAYAGQDTDGTKVTIGANVTKLPAYLFCPSNATLAYYPKITNVVFEEGSVCTEIHGSAFEICQELESVTLPNSITSIGSYAFCNCPSLKSITIPKGTTVIQNYTFHGCASLESLTLHGGVTSIGYAAFYGCTSLTSLTIPESVTSIGSYAFYNAKALKKIKFNAVAMNDLPSKNFVFTYAGQDTDGIKVTIGSEVTRLPIYLFCPNNNDFSYHPKVTSVVFEEGSVCTSICAGAFEGCNELESMVIPESVTSIGNYAFNACSALTKIDFNAIALNDFSTDQYVFGAAGQDGDGITVTIGAEVTRIPACLFYPKTSAPKITNVIFEEDSKCTSIGSYAFRCAEFDSIAIPEGVTSIEKGAFERCTGLQSITLPETVTVIGDYAFYNCTALKDAIIPENVTTIGSYAFYNCTSLESVVIPDSVTSVGEYAFYNCTAVKSLTIGAGVKTVGKEAFKDCVAIEEVHFNAVAMNDLSENYAFYNIGTYGSGIKLTIGTEVTRIPNFLFYSVYSLKTVSFEKGSKCASIGNYAFCWCENIKDISIPDSVTSVGTYAFYRSGLTSLKIGKNVTSIGANAFEWCMGLKSLTIPESVTSIGFEAFYWCTSLEELNFNAVAMNDLSNNAYVFHYIGKDSGGVKVTFGASVTKIPAYLFQYGTYITSVEFAQGSECTSIGAYAFSGCNRITGVVLPEGITSIGSAAFNECYALKSVNIPESTTSLGTYAFYDCTALEEIRFDAVAMKDLSSGNRTFGRAGQDGNGIAVTFGAKVTKIPSYLFYPIVSNYTYAPNIVSVAFEKGSVCTSIGSGVFSYVTGIKKITLPESLTSIGIWAFYNTGLESIVIPDSVTSIGANAFRDCADLKSITIGKGVKSVGAGAFENCPLLTEIKFNAVAMNDVSSEDGLFFHSGHSAGGIKVTVGSEVTRIPASLFYISGNTDAAPNIVSVVFEQGSVCEVIGNHAFRCVSTLKSIVIPDSVTSVGSYAFDYDTGLESVTIGKGVKSIGDGAFYRCVGITEISFNAVAMNDLSTSASVFSFAGIGGDGIKVTVGNEVTKIPASLFFRDGDTSYKYPPKIVSVEFEEGSVCTVIGNHAFRCIPTIESIKLPQSVKTIGEYSFSGCTGLVEVILEEGLEVIGYNSFWECSSLKSVNIPDSVTTIGAGAFQACFALESVTIPKNVVSIGNVAFGELPRLREIRFNAIALSDRSTSNSIFSRSGRSGDGITVIIGAEVTRIPANMFSPQSSDTAYYKNSAKITKVVFEEGSVCKSIGSDAFEGCSELTAIELPEGLESVGYAAFYYTGLESIVIPDSVTSIGAQAFYRCSALTSVTIGKGVKSIGDYAFYECMELKKIKFNAVAMNDLSSSNRVFKSAGRSGDGIKVTIGKDVTRVPAVLFYPYASDTNYYRWSPKITSVEFEKGSVCTSIGNYAFEGLTELESIVIPDSVTSIGNSAFYWCRGLESVTIGEGVTSISSNAFYNCTSLKTVMIKSEAIAAAMTSSTACQYLCEHAEMVLVRTGIENIGSYITSNFAVADEVVKSGGVIWTVYSDHSHAQGCENWVANEDGSNTCSVCGLIEDRIYAQGSCGETATWVLTNDGTLTISGEGAMYDYSKNTIPWRAYSSRIVKVVVEEGVTGIGSSAFNSESTQFIFTEVTLPSSLRSIGQYAFYYCASLTEIAIPENVTFIGSFAFRKCSALGSVTFVRPEAWTAGETALSSSELADGASAASALISKYYSVDMYATVNEYGELFWRFDPEGVLAIYGKGAMSDHTKTNMPWFSLASRINKVIIGEGVTSIGKSAFNSEKTYFAITELSLPSTLRSIGQYAFFGCKGITSVTLPESLETIEGFAFRKTGLVSVSFEGDAGWSIGDIEKLKFESETGAACALAVQYYNKKWTRCTDADEVTLLVDNGRCGSKVFWRLTEDGTLTITGKGEMYDFGTYTGMSGWRACSDKVKRVVIGSGVTSIGNAAFYECKSIEEVVLADSVKKIGDWAFCRCSALVEINVDKVTSIGDHTFRKCGSLADQTLVEKYGKAT